MRYAIDTDVLALIQRAVEELRGRVLSLHGFLDVLRTHHGLPAADAEAISRKVCAARNVVQPLWC